MLRNHICLFFITLPKTNITSTHVFSYIQILSSFINTIENSDVLTNSFCLSFMRICITLRLPNGYHNRHLDDG